MLEALVAVECAVEIPAVEPLSPACVLASEVRIPAEGLGIGPLTLPCTPLGPEVSVEPFLGAEVPVEKAFGAETLAQTLCPVGQASSGGLTSLTEAPACY